MKKVEVPSAQTLKLCCRVGKVWAVLNQTFRTKCLEMIPMSEMVLKTGYDVECGEIKAFPT